MIQPLPEFLNFNEILPSEENNLIEFKGIQEVKRFPDVIGRYAREYLNAFLNSHGGQLWFGIEDDSKVKGILVNQQIRDSIRLSIDAAVAQFVPQVDANLASISFIKVKLPQDYSEQYEVCEDKPWIITDKSTNEVFQMEVVVATIMQGNAPVYFTTKQHEAAFFRRDGGITKMTADTIVQRMQDGRPFCSQKPIQSELSFDIRKDIIGKSIEFLACKEPSTKVLVLYGLVSVGKSKLAEHIKQMVLIDKQLFSQQYKSFHASLKGVGEKFKKIDDILVQLIRSMKPEEDLTFVNKQLISHLSLISDESSIPLVFKESLEQQRASQTSGNTEILLNIYNNVAMEIQPFVLILENSGNCPYIHKLVPAGSKCLIILTSRSMMSLDIKGPAVSYLELSVPPLSDDEGALLVISQLGVSLEVGREISRLCAGLPQVLRLVCQNSKLYGVQPLETLRSLGEPSQRLEKLSPSLGKLLSGLSQKESNILATLSIFPGMFAEDASQFILGYNILIKTIDQDHVNLVQLGLIDRVVAPCQGLREKTWWHITQAIREYAFLHADKEDILEVMMRYIEYFTNLIVKLKEQKSLHKVNNSVLFKQITLDQIKQGVNELFLTYSKSFYVCLKLVDYFMQDSRDDVSTFGKKHGKLIIDNIKIFMHYFTSSLLVELEYINNGILGKVELKNPNVDEDEDFYIWKNIFV